MIVRRPLLAANWKMHKSVAEATAFAEALVRELSDAPAADVILAPGFTLLGAAGLALRGSAIGLAAQDVSAHESGAFTGEVSAAQLVDAGCTAVLIGHSERRQYHGESDASVSTKLVAALRHQLVPIVCIGETLAEREAGRTEATVLGQLDGALATFEGESAAADALRTLVVAYEPVWAIGTGRNATPADAQEVHAAIRARLGERLGAEAAQRLRILYGGSVKPENAAALLACPDVDGALVGGASLDVASFVRIVRAAV